MIVDGASTLERRQPPTLGRPVYHSVALTALLLLVGVDPDLHGPGAGIDGLQSRTRCCL